MKTADGLKNFVASHRPGKTLNVKVFRGGEYMDFKVTIAKRPDDASSVDMDKFTPEKAPEEMPVNEGIEAMKKLGIEEAKTFTEAIANQAKLPLIDGVVIEQVRAGSEAQRNGLRPGTIITAIMSSKNSFKDLKVTNLKMLSEEFAKHKLEGGVRLRVSQPSRSGWIERIVLLELPHAE